MTAGFADIVDALSRLLQPCFSYDVHILLQGVAAAAALAIVMGIALAIPDAVLRAARRRSDAAWRRRVREELRRMGVENAAIRDGIGRSLNFAWDERPYHFYYLRPYRSVGKYYLAAEVPSKGAFYVERRESGDRELDEFALVGNIKTGDADFDSHFAVDSEAEAFAEEFFAEESNRREVRGMIEMGFTDLNLDDQRLTAGWYANPLGPALGVMALQDGLGLIHSLAARLSGGDGTPASQDQKEGQGSP
ncbi:MAG TPA: hypothetical protein VMU17_04030 [Elusimicrobiota bacterium]|nr:hypothetical protein [Elusimicrobiota bacterium]